MKLSDTLTEKELLSYTNVLKVYYNQDINYFNKLHARVTRYGKKLIPIHKWPTHIKEKYRFIELVVNSVGNQNSQVLGRAVTAS